VPCAAGSFQQVSGSSACAACFPGEYQPEQGALECRRCALGQSSVSGADRCAICAEHYLRPAATSPVLACTPCSELHGVVCGVNTTTATLNLTRGYWRHSASTRETHACAYRGGWTPCRGGGDVGVDGDGYCAPGYRGPRCAVCGDAGYSMYFDKADARCYDCGDVASRSAPLVCILLFCVCSVLGGGWFMFQYEGRFRAMDGMIKRVRRFRSLWQSAGMRCKLKMMVGLFQCISAVPTVFNVNTPPGLEDFTRWLDIIEFPSDFGIQTFIPPTCFGTYRRRLLIGALWPIALMLLVAAGFICLELSREKWKKRHVLDLQRGSYSVALIGLQRSVPFVLVVTFLLVPSTATLIFKTFLCDRFQYDADDTRRYMHDDLSISCDSEEYTETYSVAIGMIALWPIGVPVFYAVLLWASRDALLTDTPTPLSRATAFLSGDYDAAAFWWEPIEMLRKLTLTGAVVLISEEFEQARVLVAILVSVMFLALRLTIKPFQRTEDAALMASIELALVLTYVCILLIKACEMSSAVCETFGFGGTSSGVYIFFLSFGLSILLLQLVVAALKLWFSVRLPRVFLVAKAHSVSPLTIVRRVAARRLRALKHQAIKRLHLDVTRLAPSTAAAILQFRTMRGRTPPASTPEKMLPIATGVTAELYIEGVFPRTTCFVQVDLQAFVIRWAHERFISLHTVEGYGYNLASAKRNWSLNLYRISSLWGSEAHAQHKSRSDRPTAYSANSRADRPAGSRADRPTAGSVLSQGLNSVGEVSAESAWPTRSLTPPCSRSTLAPESMTQNTSPPLELPELRSTNSHEQPSPKPAGKAKGAARDHATDMRIHLTYNDTGGLLRVLELRMPAHVAEHWNESLGGLLSTYTRVATPAHWRWALSCMAATSARGATGFLRHSELRSLLRYANASADLSRKELEEAIEEIESHSEPRLERKDLPRFLRSSHGSVNPSHHHKQLTARQVTALLLRLSTSSAAITEVFHRYAVDDAMGLPEWLAFERSEQLNLKPAEHPTPLRMRVLSASAAAAQPSSERELARAAERFERVFLSLSGGAVSSTHEEHKMSLAQFALQLLSSRNDAVAPARDPLVADDLSEPLSHYWTACSHNSYIIGDQLTGVSSADAYRRQLLQGCRQVEIDCWDGPELPIVTHGHTFCTVEQFEEVAKAIGECAFVTSDLPVVLSLEMHCSPPQQRHIARMLIKYLDEALLPYDDFVATSRPASLSPRDLRLRVLVKGKVKQRKKLQKQTTQKGSGGSQRNLGSLKKLFGSLACNVSDRSWKTASRLGFSRSAHTDTRSGRSDSSSLKEESVPSTPTRGMSFSNAAMNGSFNGLSFVAEMEKAHRKLNQEKSPQIITDNLYAACLALRSLPKEDFLGSLPPKWPLPITSISEDRLLMALGLPETERSQIEGLHIGNSLPQRGRRSPLTEEKLSSSAIVRLAANPPPEAGWLQRRTLGWLLRPFPLGLRFSGNNMSPLPCWMAGAQHVALNMSNNDLPVQLHFALFNGTGGYVLKPEEMLRTRPKDENDDEKALWPPPREELHRTTLELLSLHNLPKRGEQRPRFDGSHAACHEYAPELSGKCTPPANAEPSCPEITASVHPIGGFCAISETLPLSTAYVTEMSAPRVHGNGLRATFERTWHCVASEPHAVFLRMSVTDGGHEVAYETAVLGRLRQGYRVFQLRGALGTRIELCYLLVRITMGVELHPWATPGQLKWQLLKRHKRIVELEAELSKQQSTFAASRLNIELLSKPTLIAGEVCQSQTTDSRPVPYDATCPVESYNELAT